MFEKYNDNTAAICIGIYLLGSVFYVFQLLFMTEKWLAEHGFKWHSCLFGKPRGGNYHWIDNHIVRATRFNSKLTDFVKKYMEVEVFDDE